MLATPAVSRTKERIKVDRAAIEKARERRAADVPSRAGGKFLQMLALSFLLPCARLPGEEPLTDPRQWMVELEGESVIESWLKAGAAGRTSALGASVSRAAELERAQARVEELMAAPEIGARVQYRTQRVFNGIAVFVDPSRVEKIRSLPGVKSVTPLVLHTPAASTSVPFLDVPGQVWQAHGNAGEGIRIGIIDSGIDYQHAAFGGSGTEADYKANDRTKAPDAFFPNARVVGGYDFVGDEYGQGALPKPDPDPMDCGGHGSHVAGIAAGSGVRADGTTYPGPYDGTIPFSSLRIGPGVAPKASLYALRVFGCSGGTGLVTQALEWAVDPNKDWDFSDRLDVVNLSLGSVYGGAFDSAAKAADVAAKAGVVVVCAAGNAGDTHFVTGSPGTSDYSLSVAASVDSGVTASMLRVLQPASLAGRLDAATASFGGTPPAAGTAGPLVAAIPADGCAPISNGAELQGRIALVDRAGCDPVVKVRNAQDAGAIGVVVANDVDSVSSMSGADAAVTIPSVLVSYSDGQRLRQALPEGVTVALDSAADTLAPFSSRGPRREGSGAGPKPDISAPGLSISSVQSGVVASDGKPTIAAGSLASVKSGTSMAAPHLTGVMALLKKTRPSWTVSELKAAVMNTAGFDVSRFSPAGSIPIHGPQRVGAGRVDAARAIATEVLAFDDEHPEVVSLAEYVEGAEPVTKTRTVRVVNKGAVPVTLTPGWRAASSVPGVRIEVPRAPIVVPAGEERTFDVSVVLADPTAVTHAPDPTLARTQGSFADLSNRHWMTEASGFVLLEGGAVPLRVPLHVVARGLSDVRAASAALGVSEAGGAFTIPLVGQGLKTGPNLPLDVVSTVSAFELHGVGSGVYGQIRPWAGAASSIPSGGFGPDATVWFGIGGTSGWLSPSESQYTIEIDRNGDLTPDATVTTMPTSDVPSPDDPNVRSAPTDVIVAGTSIARGAAVSTYRYVNLDPALRDTNLFGSNVLVVPAPAGENGLGLSAGNARFRYRITRSSRLFPVTGTDETAWYTFDAEKPGYSVLAADGTPFHDDLGGTALPARYDPAAAQATGALGVLLLHHHDARASRIEVLTERNTPPTVSIAAPTPQTAYIPAGLGLHFHAEGSDPDAGDTLSYLWDLCDGRKKTGALVSASFPRAGSCTVRVTVTDGAGATATAQVVVTVEEPEPDLGLSRLLPVVLDVRGVGGAPFTTELTLVSRMPALTTVLLRYTAAVGSGTGWAGVGLEGRGTRVIPDVIAYLRRQGLPIPDDGTNQVGTLEVMPVGATKPSDFFVGARTSTPGDGGTFGLFYADSPTATSTAIVAGLQENDAMRSNLAVVNAGAEPVTLAIRLLGPLGEDLGALEDATLPAWGWKQYDRPLLGKAASGRALVARIAGSSPFSAYGVLNDAGTSDGSYIPPHLPGAAGPADLMIPVVLDVQGLGTSRYATEVTLANLGATPLALALSYVATAQFGGGSGSVPLTLAAGEQRILPDILSYLRDGGLAIPEGGANVAGSLQVKSPAGASSGVLVAGARAHTGSTLRPGTFGVYYPGLTTAESADGPVSVNGLRQDASMRSNVAFVNVGDAGAVTLRVTFYDESGQVLERPEEWALGSGEWRQLGQPLGTRGATAGSARIERVSGKSRFIAYGVLNDAATSDGSYLPMSR
jgi:subtilisin family serine protease